MHDLVKETSYISTNGSEILSYTCESYSVGTWGSFPVGKAAGCEADHSPPTSAEVKNTWVYISTPPYVFMAQIAKHRDNYLLPCTIKMHRSLP
jgi:hypothetical protein